VPNGSLLTTWENSMFVSGVSAYPYRLYWSYPGEPLNWPAASVVDLGADSADPITALASLGPNLLVFKERGIWAVYDSETGANRKIADNVGTLSPRSVIPTERGCYFFDPQQGLMVTDGSMVSRVSSQLDESFKYLTVGQKSSVACAYWQQSVYVSVEEASGRAIYQLDTQLDSWWKHSPQMTQLVTWDRGEGLQLIGASASAGQLVHLFKRGETQDLGSTFESYWSGPFHTFGVPHLRKRTRRIHLDGRGTVDVYVAVDYDLTKGDFQQRSAFSGPADGSTFGGAGSFGGSGSFGSQISIGEDVVYTSGIGRSFSVSIYSAASEFWELDAYTMLMTQMRN